MKNCFLLFLFFNSYFLAAQQNYFNVVSSEITPPKKIFFQQQINANRDLVFNSTLNAGVTKNFELGFNLFGLDYEPHINKFLTNPAKDKGNVYPIALLNSQYKWLERKHVSFTSGLQYGGYLYQVSKTPVYFIYTNAKLKTSDEKLNGVMGLYYGDRSYVGLGDHWGLQAGVEYALVKHKIHLVADALISKQDIAGAVLGCSLFVSKHFPISLGWQIPFMSKNNQAFVLELTYLP